MLPRGAGDNSIAPPSRYLDVFMALLDSDADLGEEVRSGRLWLLRYTMMLARKSGRRDHDR
jgi:hypothetical protein